MALGVRLGTGVEAYDNREPDVPRGWGELAVPLSRMLDRGASGIAKGDSDLAFLGFAQQSPCGLAEPYRDTFQGGYLEVLPAAFNAPIVRAVHFDVIRKSLLRPLLLFAVLADHGGDAMLQGGACDFHQRYFTADDLQSQAP